MTNEATPLSDSDLSVVSGGIRGLLGYIEDRDAHETACKSARHWTVQALKPGADKGTKQYAKYLRQFCPRLF